MAVIKLDPEKKKMLLEEIQQHFQQERDESISVFQAENYLEFILVKAGVYIYNQAIADAQTFMAEKAEELFVLEKQYKES